MIINLSTLFKISLFLLLSTSSLAKEKLKLATFQIPQYVQNASKGTFVEITEKIASMAGVKVEIVVLPPKRALKHFQQKKVDGYFPALDALGHGDVYKSKPFYYKKDFVFMLDKLEPFKKGRICVTTGYPYDLSKLQGDFTFIEAHSDKACLQILKKGRADFFIVELYTGVLAVNDLGLKNVVIKPKALWVNEVYFAFQKTSEGKVMRDSFSKAIQELKKKGTLSQFFSEASKLVQTMVDFGYDPTVKD